MKNIRLALMVLCLLAVLMTGCGREDGGENVVDVLAGPEADSDVGSFAGEVITASEMFTDRDLRGEYDPAGAEEILLSEGDVTITEEGVYLVSGSLEDGMILVEAKETDKVQLVLCGVEINNSANAAIYVKQADKVFITLAAGSENSLTSGGYTSIDDNNIDGVIFAKSDLTINGTGKLSVSAAQGHGIVSKDDLKIAGGEIAITAESHGLSGKDSVRVTGCTLDITSGKDAVHGGSGNEENKDGKGFVYIADGELTLNAGDDGIHGESTVRIAGGNIRIPASYEGIEGSIVEISGGDIRLDAADDGVNAAGGSDRNAMEIRITGGVLYVHAGGDGLDSNGSLTVSGGQVYISGPEDGANGAIDYETTARITGGKVVAVGSRAMAMNFGDTSTQGSILAATSSHEAGTMVVLQDSGGGELLSYSTESAFDSVVVSCPELALGETYTITVGEESVEVTLEESLISGTGFQMEGFGGGHRPMPGGGRSEGDEFEPDRDFPGRERPSMPEGARPSMPDGERLSMPEGARPSMPEGERPSMPEGERPSMSEEGMSEGRPYVPEGDTLEGYSPGEERSAMPEGDNKEAFYK